MRSEHVAVIGAGHMGQGIAQIFAANGHEVMLFDSDEDGQEEAIEKIRSNLIALADHGFCLQEEIEPTLAQIRPTCSLKDAVANARFVVEALSEDLEAKQILFHKMEKFCSPITILATHTAEISVSAITAKTKAKERVVGTHFWSPPYLIPLVEVAGGDETLKEVMEYTCNILKSVGKHPVMVPNDVPGQIGNRLQHALWREAGSMIAQGIADPNTVNDIIKKGLSPLLSVQGPLGHADSNCPHKTLQRHGHLLRCIECFLKLSEP